MQTQWIDANQAKILQLEALKKVDDETLLGLFERSRNRAKNGKSWVDIRS